MRHWLCVFIAAVLTLTLAPVIASHAQGDIPRPRVCLPVQIWNERIVKPAHAEPLFIGTEADGTMTLVMLAPDNSPAVFNISADGALACLVALPMNGDWNKGLVQRLIFGNTPARNI